MKKISKQPIGKIKRPTEQWFRDKDKYLNAVLVKKGKKLK